MVDMESNCYSSIVYRENENPYSVDIESLFLYIAWRNGYDTLRLYVLFLFVVGEHDWSLLNPVNHARKHVFLPRIIPKRSVFEVQFGGIRRSFQFTSKANKEKQKYLR